MGEQRRRFTSEEKVKILRDQVTHNLSPSLAVVLHNTLFPETFAPNRGTQYR